MTDVAFYHLTRSPLDAVLPRLLEKAYAGGHRVVLRIGDEEAVRRIDRLLWTYDNGSFLPHGTDFSDNKGLHPILITMHQDVPNGAGILMLIEGSIPDDLGRFERVLYLFEAGDEAAVALARQNWAGLKTRDDVSRSYWQQDERGGWKRAQ